MSTLMQQDSDIYALITELMCMIKNTIFNADISRLQVMASSQEDAINEMVQIYISIWEDKSKMQMPRFLLNVI